MLKVNPHNLTTLRYRFDGQVSETDILTWLYNFDEAVKEDSFMDIGYYLHDNLVHYKPLNKLAIDVVRYMNL